MEMDLAESGIIRWVSHKGRGVEIFKKILPSPHSVRAFFKVLRNYNMHSLHTALPADFLLHHITMAMALIGAGSCEKTIFPVLALIF
jgi:hypothetical protein